LSRSPSSLKLILSTARAATALAAAYWHAWTCQAMYCTHTSELLGLPSTSCSKSPTVWGAAASPTVSRRSSSRSAAAVSARRSAFAALLLVCFFFPLFFPSSSISDASSSSSSFSSSSQMETRPQAGRLTEVRLRFQPGSARTA